MTLINGDHRVVYKINGREPPPALRLHEFEIDYEEGIMPEAVFTFENEDQRLGSKELGVYILPGNRITFSYGYVGQMSKPQTFVVKKQKGYKEIKLYAYPDVKNADDEKKRTFKDSKYSSIAKKMAAELGLKADVKETDCKEKSLPQTNETNMKFLKRAAEELHFTLGYDNGTLTFKPRDYAQKPVHHFYYRKGRIQGAVIDFDPEKNVFEIPAAFKDLFVDPKTGKIVELKSNNETVKRDLLGGKNAPIAGAKGGISKPSEIKAQNPKKQLDRVTLTESKIAGNDVVIEHQAPASRARKAQAQCLSDDKFKKAEDNLIKAKLVAIGAPKLRDKEVIQLHGVIPTFAGPWYTHKVTHKLGKDYIVTMQLYRNGLPKSNPNTKTSGVAKSAQLEGAAGGNPATVEVKKPVAHPQKELSRAGTA